MQQHTPTLYVRPDCLLCLLATRLLQAAGIAHLTADIEEQAALEQRYGTRIPVLVRGDGGELDWPFDAAALRAFLG